MQEEMESRDALILCLDQSSPSAYFQRLEWKHAVTEKKPPVIIALYAGKWRRGYEKHDAFPFVKLYQRYRWDDATERERAMEALDPPDNGRFQLMRDVVIEAGTLLMQRYGLRLVKGMPGPLDARKNYSTEADREVDRHIIDRIRAEHPGEPILSEESCPELGVKDLGAEFVWTVDALDGTLNFVSGDDRFCCGIGLLREGKPYMGAILVPSRMELYTGGKGRPAERRLLLEGGAERMQSDHRVTELCKCHTLTHVNSEEENIDLCFKGGFPKRLHHAVSRVWMWGCGLMGLLALSRGSHHLFVQRVTYPWDLVPGLAILHSAGGVDSAWPCKKPGPWTLRRWRAHRGVAAACNEEVLKAFRREFNSFGT